MTHKKKRIFFRVDGDHGANSGLGHLYRTLRMYFYLKKKFNQTHKFYFITKNYEVGKRIINNKTREKVNIYNSNFLKNFTFLKNDKIIIDTLGAEKKFLSKLKRDQVDKIVSFDELNLSLYDKAIIINGIFFSKKKLISNNKNLQIFQNPKYILLDEEFKIKKNIQTNNKVLITSGGADKKNILYRISKILLKSDIKNLKIYVLIGKGVKKNNPIYKYKNLNKITFVENNEKIKKYLDSCSIVIASGGIVMFEAIASGRTTLVFKIYEHQKYAIKYFRDLDLITDFNGIKKINKKRFIKKFKLLFENNIIMKKNYINNIKNLDGKGFDRIKKILCKYIKDK